MPEMVICIDCGRDARHHALGMCAACYQRHLYRTNPDHHRKKLTARAVYHRAHQKERSLYEKNRYQERREKEILRGQNYYAKHREERLAYRKNYYQNHRERELAKVRCYGKENPQKRAANDLRRRARKAATHNTLMPEQLEYEMNIGRALYPGQQLHIHHLVPLSKGGGHAWGNIAVIPASLNLAIGDKLPEEVYRQRRLQSVGTIGGFNA